MTTYRELVQRTVACRHADLELGLSRAREQEPFVIHVSDLLDKAGIEYAVRMDKDFQTTFCVEFSATAPADVIGIWRKYYSVFLGPCGRLRQRRFGFGSTAFQAA